MPMIETQTYRIRCDEAQAGDVVIRPGSSNLTVLRLGPIHSDRILGVPQKVLMVKVRDDKGSEKWKKWRPDTNIRVQREEQV